MKSYSPNGVDPNSSSQARSEDAKLARRGWRQPLAMSAVLRYGLALFLVSVALVLSQAFLYYGLPQPFTPIAQPFTALALAATAINFWYGGTKPGVLAALISWLFRDYLFESDISTEARLLYGLVFLVFAFVMTLIMRGRNELEAKVVGRTAELRQNEQAVRESEAKFRDYAETASDWFWEIGPDYKFTLLTENAFGSDSADRIGTACWEHALDLETEPEKWRLVRAALDSRQPFRDFVYCSARRNGSPMYVKGSGKPVFDANGEFRGYRGTGTDVTAIVRAQEEHERLRQLESDLAHMNRLSVMGELTASLAHEITQPIATARNNARAAMGFLDRSPPDLSEVREALECIVADADRAGDIIDRIRDQIKKAPPRKCRFDLNEAIDEVIALAGSAITTNGVSVRTRLTEGLAHVQGDRVQLQQVVLNLILNAVEAMSTVEAGPRELLISTEQTQTGGVLVSVRDSGPGIDPDHLDRVFEAFYTTKSSGVGMGLSICRSIIDAHGGRLWADMNASRGAVFRFTLPDADKELTDSLRPAHLTREPHKD